MWLKDAAMLYAGHTAGKHIFMSAISYPCKSLVSAHIFATEDCKHLKTQLCIAKCAQHFILAGRAACISAISLYMLVQNICHKGFCVYTSCFRRRRRFENYILFEDKMFGITHGLICLPPRVRVSCHLRK